MSFPVRPLYTELDGVPEAPLPGDWPFVRGADAHRDVLAGWKVVEEFPAAGASGADANSDVNAAILASLVDGVSALLLRVGSDDIAPADLDRALKGVYLELAPVILDAGDDFRAAADALLALVGGCGLTGRGQAVDRPRRRSADCAVERAPGGRRR